jgi:hypothetical protein
VLGFSHQQSALHNKDARKETLCLVRPGTNRRTQKKIILSTLLRECLKYWELYNGHYKARKIRNQIQNVYFVFTCALYYFSNTSKAEWTNDTHIVFHKLHHTIYFYFFFPFSPKTSVRIAYLRTKI